MTGPAMLTLAFGGFALMLGAGQPARAQSCCASNPNALIVYHAGSLNAAFTAVEELLTEQTGICSRRSLRPAARRPPGTARPAAAR